MPHRSNFYLYRKILLKNKGIVMTDQPPTPPTVATPTTQTKQIGRYHVEVSRDKCIGAASCVAIAPQVFELDETQIATVISQDGNDDDTKLLAAQSCPTMAIVITDTQTGQQVWPPAA
jgi:ferredoxin